MQFSFIEAIQQILASSGFAALVEDPRSLIMILISFVLLYLGIGKKFEPLLLVPIAFGILLANLSLIHIYAVGFIPTAFFVLKSPCNSATFNPFASVSMPLF